MKLIYCETGRGNFGDDLNLWLWNELFPDNFFDGDEHTHFYGIGTILHRKIDRDVKKVIFGSGVGYKRAPVVDDKFNIYFVRGKLTAKALGVADSLAITDPAYLVLETDYFRKEPDKTYKVSFVPHHLSVDDVGWNEVLASVGIHYIDPTGHYLTVIDQIRQSEMIISESLHGAILADAFRVPWLPVKFGYRFLNSKWVDWCDSIGVGFSAVDLPLIYCGELNRKQSIKNYVKQNLGFVKEKWKKRPYRQSTEQELESFSNLLADIQKSSRFYLSSDDQFESLMNQLTSKVSKISEDFRNGRFISG